jgi:hypothetical protein
MQELHATSELEIIQAPPTNILCIHGEGGEPIVTIKPNGTVEFGEGYTPTEAARIFWEALAWAMPESVRAKEVPTNV